MSSVQLFSSFFTLNYDRLVPNTRSRTTARILCLLGGLVLGLVVASIGAIVFGGFQIVDYWNAAKVIGNDLVFLPLAILCMGIVQIVNSWYARETKLAPVSWSVIAYTVTYIAVALFLGVLDLKSGALIIAHTSAFISQLFVLVFFLQKTKISVQCSAGRLLSAVRCYSGQALSLTLVRFVNTLSLAAPVFLLAELHSAAQLGVYALLVRVIVTPLGVLTKSLSLSFGLKLPSYTDLVVLLNCRLCILK